ncbi:DUF2087 domain-containing protein [Acinetobacter rongchengensis]|uniref:DUF2087 domain-containing protein n=1 Tax=Acinetobacter rongchengensis TaxID=2419601 RepID=A0A3A8F1X1_9GAMM|nr:DUF2087 domain-containing protein [Acinetobacter rongchengensis]RKG40845.1 DUF2087 domain-containing protein [Acinetobacter rongchengensis]
MNTTTSEITVHQQDLLVILQRLLKKKDFTLKNLKQEEFQTCLGLASLTIPSSQILNEKDVNQALKHWLNSTGSILWIDHVELRRTLIDYGFLHRNLAGNEYQRLQLLDKHPAKTYIDLLSTMDIDVTVFKIKQQLEQQKLERMNQHMKGAH